MRKALKYLILPLLCAISVQTHAQQEEGEFVRQVHKRDSILIGDQVDYGFIMKGVEEGTLLEVDPSGAVKAKDAVSDWSSRTLSKTSQGEGLPDLKDEEMSIRLALFEEGQYELPPIVVVRTHLSGHKDTVMFDPVTVDVKTIPLDTASFKPHPMKPMIRTPFNWDEFLYNLGVIRDWLIGHWKELLLVKWGIILLVAGICFRRASERKDAVSAVEPREPAHIVALRKLDAFRGNALWVPERQKELYTGVTDALREYISRIYGIGAMEMTTAELFRELKSVEELSDEQKSMLKDLFETADFVKFAKFVATDEDIASAVPKAVRFVTETYQKEIGGGENVS